MALGQFLADSLVTFGEGQAYQPGEYFLEVLGCLLGGVVQRDKNSSEKNGIGDDNKHHRHPSPLQSENFANSSVCLTGVDRTDAGGVRWQSFAVRTGIAIEESPDIHVDAVAHGCYLKYQGSYSKDQNGNPVILCAVFDIDMAHFSESKRDTG